MKFKCDFDCRVVDAVQPARHPPFNVGTTLEFPFPKNLDQLYQQLRTQKNVNPDAFRSAKSKKLQEYLNIDPDQFADDFRDRMSALVQKNYEAVVKHKVKPNFDKADWQALIAAFSRNQIAFVAHNFSKELAEVSTAANDLLEEIKKDVQQASRPRKVQLGEAESFMLWTKEAPLSFATDSKFEKDHIAGSISHPDIIRISVERYLSEGGYAYSWIAASKASIEGKAKSGSAYPHLFKGKQQVSVKVKAPCATVKIVKDFVAKGDKAKSKAESDKHNVKIGDDGRFLTIKFDSAAEFYVYGNWNHQTGEVEIHHFDTVRPSIGMLPSLKEWSFDSGTGEYARWK